MTRYEPSLFNSQSEVPFSSRVSVRGRPSLRCAVSMSAKPRRSSLGSIRILAKDLEKFRESILKESPRRNSIDDSTIQGNSTMDRKRRARLQRMERERKAKEEKTRQEAEKRKRARELRSKMKQKDKKDRQKHEILSDGTYVCPNCSAKIKSSLFEDHLVEHPSHIKQRIWLGDSNNSKDSKFIKSAKITHILNCTHEIEITRKVNRLLKGFKRISMMDRTTSNLFEHIKDSILWIDNVLSNKNNILFIHCREGKSRSVSFLCSYLIWKENISFESALAQVKSKRHIAMPNPKFYRQLQQFSNIIEKEKLLKNKNRKFKKSKYKFKLKPVKQNKKNIINKL